MQSEQFVDKLETEITMFDFVLHQIELQVEEQTELSSKNRFLVENNETKDQQYQQCSFLDLEDEPAASRWVWQNEYSQHQNDEQRKNFIKLEKTKKFNKLKEMRIDQQKKMNLFFQGKLKKSYSYSDSFSSAQKISEQTQHSRKNIQKKSKKKKIIHKQQHLHGEKKTIKNASQLIYN